MSREVVDVIGEIEMIIENDTDVESMGRIIELHDLEYYFDDDEQDESSSSSEEEMLLYEKDMRKGQAYKMWLKKLKFKRKYRKTLDYL